jgi:hypothetical protein
MKDKKPPLDNEYFSPLNNFRTEGDRYPDYHAKRQIAYERSMTIARFTVFLVVIVILVIVLVAF